MARSRDTTADAEAVQLRLYRTMTSAQRTAIGDQMSIDARLTALAAIRARHPDDDEATARWALFRMLWATWPHAPLVDLSTARGPAPSRSG